VRAAAEPLISIASRIRGRSIDELRVRSVQALQARIERLSDRFMLHLRGFVPEHATESLVNRGVDLLSEVDPAVIARLPSVVPAEPHGAPAAASEPGHSGRMTALASTAGGWTQLELEEPRRG
jgi:hypothetical protein